MKVTFKIILAVVAILVSTSLNAGHASESIVGTWRLISITEQDTESKAMEKTFGDNPIGFLTYTSDGRMTVIITSSNRKPASSAKATEAEAAHLYGTMVAYAGTYRIDGDRVRHHIEASWNQASNGIDVLRFASVENNRLTLSTPPFVGVAGLFVGKRIQSTLLWERVP
jgi:Lipocalin-like domain